MEDLIERASSYAFEKHKNQMRKYNTGEPYFVHLHDVAALVYHYTSDPEMTAAAFLHDVVEDQGVSIFDIKELFGDKVAQYVDELTDISKPSDGNRATRKEIDRLYIAQASPQAKTIKCADLISNTMSIVEHAPDFAPVYLEEKRKLLEVLEDASCPELWEAAKKRYEIAMSKLDERRKKC
jgi:(p)ppGpp synthase/HD superfamily hydrolase